MKIELCGKEVCKQIKRVTIYAQSELHQPSCWRECGFVTYCKQIFTM